MCVLISRLSEPEVEALRGIAELFVRGPDAQLATDAPAQQGSAAASAGPSPVVPSTSPDATTLSPSGGRPTYTVAEAARLLGMTESALRERIRMGRVRVLRLGRRVLVKREELERLLAEGEARSRR